MSAIIGTVSRVAGEFSLQKADGSLSEVSRNSEIYEGDTLRGSQNSSQLNSLSVTLTDGSEFLLMSDESQLFDSSLLAEEFALNETVSDIESIEAVNSKDVLDEIDTEAGEEGVTSHSSTAPDSTFAQISDDGIDINAELKDVEKLEETETLDNKYETYRESNISNLDETNSEIADMVADMSESISSVNLAVIAANDAARLASSVASIASSDPTPENLAAAERAQITANVASIDVANSATFLEQLVVDLNAAADVAGTKVDTRDATDAIDNANAASLVASTVAINSELTTDSVVEEMLQNVADLNGAANTVAEHTSAAVDIVSTAAQEVENNPTSENLEALQRAQDAANFAAHNAENIAKELEDAISDLNEAADAANEIVDTTDALETVKNVYEGSSALLAAAIAAEAISDAKIADMVSDVSDLTDAANDAATVANSAATTADNAASTAEENPTPENLEAAEVAQAAADTAAVAATDAATDLTNAITELNEAADAADETVDTTAAQTAVESAATASTLALNAADESESVTDSEISDLLASANSAADAANALVQIAEDAADTLAANENPTAEDIATSQNAIDAADAAIVTASDAATSYENAATAAGETPVDTTVVGSTDETQADLDTAVAAEIDSDSEISDLLASANAAATTANEVIADAVEATETLSLNQNPTAADIATAQDAIDAADGAIVTANTASTTYEDAATAAGETPVDTTVVGSTDEAQADLDTAVAAEIDSDSEVSDLLASANAAATTANEAIADAAEATQTLSDNQNPTDADIATAQDAVDAADAAIETAADAASTYEDAATAAGEIPVDTTVVGTTTDVQSDLDTAVTAEIDSDEQISDMVSGVVSLTDIAEVAAQNANFTASEANEAVRIANENPTVENLENAQSAQEVAVTTATKAIDAAETLENAISELNEAANAANETVDSEVLSAANDAVDSADSSADNANQSANSNLNVSTVGDSDETANAVDENVADGTYTGVTLNAVDVDGEAVTYSVAVGVPFSVNADGQVVVDGDIDFETTPSYTFDVTATSADGTSSTQSVTVDVRDISEVTVATQESLGVNDVVTHTQEQEVEVEATHDVLDTDAMEAAGYTQVDGVWTGTREETFTNTRTEIQEQEVEVEATRDIADTDAMEEAGIYESNGSYFKDETSTETVSEKVVLNKGSTTNFDLNNGAGDLSVDMKLTGNASAEITVLYLDGSTETIDLNDGVNNFSDVQSLEIESTGKSAVHLEGISSTSTQAVEVDPIMTTETYTTPETQDVEVEVEFEDTQDVTYEVSEDDMITAEESYTTVETQEVATDTLLIGEDMQIDMSGLGDSITNIETIDLGAGTQNITSLSTLDVLDMTDTDNLLRIDGDSTDSIDLNTQGDDAEWTLGDFKTDTETGVTYQEATSGEGDATVTLEISTDIEISES